jgi:hypothetical protein
MWYVQTFPVPTRDRGRRVSRLVQKWTALPAIVLPFSSSLTLSSTHCTKIINKHFSSFVHLSVIAATAAACSLIINCLYIAKKFPPLSLHMLASSLLLSLLTVIITVILLD